MLGFILTKIYDVKYIETYKKINVYSGNFPRGISLGLYIIIDSDSNLIDKKHEWGHTRQSVRWSWLYLPIVGVFSGIRCLLYNLGWIKKIILQNGLKNRLISMVV